MSIIERALGKLQQTRNEPATIPVRRRHHDPTHTDTSSTVRAKRVPTETIDVSLDMLRKGGVLAPEEHMHSIIDQFRRVKWPLLQTALAHDSPDPRPSNLIMVTSSISGEGKTFTSFNLAMSIAREADWSVVLVDADVAKRHASEVFGLLDRRGLNDAIQDPTVDPESLVLGTSIQGLYVLPAGRKSSTAPELFASQRMADIANTLASYDPHRIVLFDSSPLLATNESQVLSKLVGQIVLVVRAEATPQPMVMEAVGLLENTEKVRCILNQVRASRMTEYYYEYGYYPNDKPKD